MKKRFASLGLALALVLMATVPVFAGSLPGADQDIEGDGFVGFGTMIEKTISPVFEAVVDTDTEVGAQTLTVEGTDKENIPGAEITVTFPRGGGAGYADPIDVVTTVDASGYWKVTVPSTITLQDGDRLSAVQKETGKRTSDPTVVIVGDGNNGGTEPPVIIDPPIDEVDPAYYLNLEIPTTFQWWVTQSTYKEVMSPTHKIVNNGLKAEMIDAEGNPTAIVKEYESSVEVTLTDFNNIGNQNNSLLTNLELNLTDDLRQGALGADIARNEISNNAIAYTTLLEDGDIWTFGFDGEFSGNLPSSAWKPQYKMTLHFECQEPVPGDGFPEK